MHTDPIADFLTRIRNAQAVGKHEVTVSYSRLKAALADLLVKEGYLSAAEKLPGSKFSKKQLKEKQVSKNFEYLKVVIKYDGHEPRISNLRRVSKPGRRIYVSKDELPFVRSGFGIAIISTAQGLMSNKQARKLGLGGEVICEVY